MPFFKYLDQLPIMIHSTDKNDTLKYANHAWKESLGYKEVEFIGLPLEKFLTKNSQIFVNKFSNPLLYKKGEIKDIPLEFIRKDGKVIHTIVSSKKIEDVQSKKVYISFVHNISKTILGTPVLKSETESSLIHESEFSINMANFRKSIEYTQEAMAEVLDMSIRNYQRIEHGEAYPTMLHLLKLVQYFHISPLLFFKKKTTEPLHKIGTILIVEDLEELSEILKEELTCWGFEVVTVPNGMEALLILEDNTFDHIITDLQMPVMDGYTLLSKIKNSYDGNVFICSGAPDHSRLKKMGLPKERVFQKPFSFEEIKQVLFKTLIS